MSNQKAKPNTRASFSADSGKLTLWLMLAALLHAGAAAAVLALRGTPLRPPEEPPRIEVLFGHQGQSVSGGAAGEAGPSGHDGTAAAPPAEALLPAASGQPGQSAAAPAAPAAPDTPGVRVERPDPAMIAAKDDPGNAAPPYPDEARRNHIEGTVLIRLHIDAAGRVAWLETLHSSGDASLDDAAETTLAHWHFWPALRDGVAVPSYRDQPVRFTIE